MHIVTIFILCAQRMTLSFQFLAISFDILNHQILAGQLEVIWKVIY